MTDGSPVEFFVAGLPRPKGSMKYLPIVRTFPITVRSAQDLLRCGRLTSTTEGLVDWQRAIGWAAHAAMGQLRAQALCGYAVAFHFALPKPQRLKFDRPIVRPDVDKLVRAVCDALTGVVWHDDSQVLHLSAEKAYVGNVAQMGVTITITRLPVGEALRPVKPPQKKAEQLPLLTEAAADDF